jgi:prepilin-type N-terminal cleavage/methylation domain-containing protein
MKRDMNKKQNGFTLVELLTVMAVVGILLGLLIPALNQIGKTATKVKQKAQFHTLGIGLEAFYSDMGYYPQSEPVIDTSAFGAKRFSASQILAEAMIGRDGLGFHPNSEFYASGQSGGVDVYDSTDPSNLSARKGPYLELESANAVELEKIYPDSILPTTSYLANGTGTPPTLSNFVLADMYKQVKHLGTGKQIGMPILYYRANTAPTMWDWSTYTNATQSAYNVYDALSASLSAGSDGIAGLDTPFGGVHPLIANPSLFYNKIQNPNFTNPERPYRAQSFILHSAGEDGLYGTEDDIFNFDQDN